MDDKQTNHLPTDMGHSNRCAIARCAGSPTASTVAAVKTVDSARVALSLKIEVSSTSFKTGVSYEYGCCQPGCAGA